MSEQDPGKVLRSIHEALNKRDVDKAVSFFADDVVSVSPEGTFKGKAEIRRYFEWLLHQNSEFKLTETGLYVEGNVVTHEYVAEATTKDGKGSLPCIAIAEIKNGKVQRIRNYYDRVTLAKQMAKGVIATRAVNSIISQMEKGLH
jgi:ketosteroid isomerase-like protein